MARILVIDDDAPVRTTVKLLLERRGHDVVAADDGRSGLKLIADGRFDLLIVDIFMPAMDGLETIRSVRGIAPDLSVVVMSGSSFRSTTVPAPDFLSMAVKLGATGAVQKPFKPQQLIATIERALAEAAQHPKAGTR